MTTTMEARREQRMTALEKANHIRVARRELKERIKAGEQTVAEVLSAPPEWVASMLVVDLLGAQRGWGKVKTRKRLGQVHVGPSAKVEDLSEARRKQLIAVVNGVQDLAAVPIPARKVVVEFRPRQLETVEEQVLRAVTDLPSTSEHVAMRIAAKCGSSPQDLAEILTRLEHRGFIRSGAAFGGRRGYYRVREQIACAA